MESVHLSFVKHISVFAVNFVKKLLYSKDYLLCCNGEKKIQNRGSAIYTLDLNMFDCIMCRVKTEKEWIVFQNLTCSY